MFGGHPTSASYGTCKDNSSIPGCDCGYAFKDPNDGAINSDYAGGFYRVNLDINRDYCEEMIRYISEEANLDPSYVIDPDDVYLIDVKFGFHKLGLSHYQDPNSCDDFNSCFCSDEYEEEGGCSKFTFPFDDQRSYVRGHADEPCPGVGLPGEYDNLSCTPLPANSINVVSKPLSVDCVACPDCCCKAIIHTSIPENEFLSYVD